MLRRKLLQLLLLSASSTLFVLPSIASASGGGSGGGGSGGGGSGGGGGGAGGGGGGSGGGAGGGGGSGGGAGGSGPGGDNSRGGSGPGGSGPGGSGPESSVSGSRAGDFDSQNAAIADVEKSLGADGMSSVSPGDLDRTLSEFQ